MQRKKEDTYIPLYNGKRSKLFLGNTRLSSVAYSMFLGIKDVSKTYQRRYKDVRERRYTEVDRILKYDYQPITLNAHPSFI